MSIIQVAVIAIALGILLIAYQLRGILGNHPKAANDNHLKTGQR